MFVRPEIEEENAKFPSVPPWYAVNLVCSLGFQLLICKMRGWANLVAPEPQTVEAGKRNTDTHVYTHTFYQLSTGSAQGKGVSRKLYF